MQDTQQAPEQQPDWWFECNDGLHNCFNTDQPCGCRCDDCRDDTEPRCNTCNDVLDRKGACPNEPH